jgi:hypothetical protein
VENCGLFRARRPQSPAAGDGGQAPTHTPLPLQQRLPEEELGVDGVAERKCSRRFGLRWRAELSARPSGAPSSNAGADGLHPGPCVRRLLASRVPSALRFQCVTLNPTP